MPLRRWPLEFHAELGQGPPASDMNHRGDACGSIRPPSATSAAADHQRGIRGAASHVGAMLRNARSACRAAVRSLPKLA